MGKKIDLTGKVFGSWSVLGQSERKTGKLLMWDCRCKCGNSVAVLGTNLTRGLTSSCGKCRNVYGLAENDLNSPNSCPYYRVWKRVLERSIAPDRDEVYPSYVGVGLFEGWLKLSNFKSWMEGQNWANLEIDKDLLVPGSREYSPTTCAFIPKKINLLLGTSDQKRGECPIGVSLHNDGPNKYIARSGGKYLGLFDKPEEAHKVWQLEKSASIVETVQWWQFDPAVNHSFNQTIAHNLFRLADKLLIERDQGVETKSLKV